METKVSFELMKIPFGRRGSFWYARTQKNGDTETLYLCGLLSGLNLPCQRDGNILSVTLKKDGAVIPYQAKGSPLCAELSWEGGTGRIVIQEAEILRLEFPGSVQIILTPILYPHEFVKSRNDGSWEICMLPTPKLLLYPVRGSMQITTSFDLFRSIPGDTYFTFAPDTDGIIDIAIHLYKINGFRCPSYPPFDKCIRDTEKDFGDWLQKAPALPPEWEAEREFAAYMVWSHIMRVSGQDLIYMNKGIHKCISCWQQSHHAIGQYNNPEFAWELLESIFHFQDISGMLPDTVMDDSAIFNGTKPPLQGVAWQFLKEFTDFSFVSTEKMTFFYSGLRELVYWWLSFRDTDHDMLPQYDTADESGWDDSSVFAEGSPISTPDLGTYVILAMDALSEIAERLGKQYEARDWKKKADETTRILIEKLWDGHQFVGRLCDNNAPVACGSVIRFIPLLLGNRLPQSITDAMIEELSLENRWLTPFGLAGEELSSPRYRESGWLSGPVLAPAQLLICLGLRASRRNDLAALITRRYAEALKSADFPMIMSATTGADVSEGRWGERYPNRMAWTAMVFLVLGSLYL